MKAAISSEENRSAGNSIIFDVDESNFDKEADRVITKANALNGTVVTTNWGYPEWNVLIVLGNVFLSYSDYIILIAMKEDDSYTYLFTYKEETYRCLIQSASGVQADDGRYLCSISLSVIEKYTDMETS